MNKAAKNFHFQQRISGKIEATVCGIPCLIGVDHFNSVAGNSHADNPDDYYGYTEVDFTVYDRKGYKADWLARKMSKDDEESVRELIVALYSEYEDEY